MQGLILLIVNLICLFYIIKIWKKKNDEMSEAADLIEGESHD